MTAAAIRRALERAFPDTCWLPLTFDTVAAQAAKERRDHIIKEYERELPITQRLDVLAQEVRALRAQPNDPLSRRRQLDGSKQLLPLSEAARILGISRKVTLMRLIADGAIATVQAPRGPRVPRREVDRLLNDGIPEPGARRARRKSRRRPAPPTGDVAAEIRAIKIE